ncbi:hypothetical protein [Ralstonia mannitolilytica]|uniref:hypothetical protein n=1 Tax=Ralstonia mannitolilytica TaxID=105219 RepID=UPI003B83E995
MTTDELVMVVCTVVSLAIYAACCIGLSRKATKLPLELAEQDDERSQRRRC